MGNPGAGKSTLLNCMMVKKDPNIPAEKKFKSGVSLVHGKLFV